MMNPTIFSTRCSNYMIQKSCHMLSSFRFIKSNFRNTKLEEQDFNDSIDPDKQSLESPMLPSPSEFSNLLNTSMKYIQNDIYNNHKISPGGSGYRWIHSHDTNEMSNAESYYNKFQESIPINGDNLDNILSNYFNNIHTCTADNQPGYMAWVPSGGLPQSAIANFIASSTNRCSTMFMIGPVNASIEDCVINWFIDIIGLKKHNNKHDPLNCNPNIKSKVGGILTSGGSMATFQAIHAARDKYLNGDSHNILKLTIYLSEQSHYCIEQGASLCGIPMENLRYIESNNDCTMNYNTIEKLIKKDLKNNMIPMMITCNAGTTNSGAIDNFNQIYKICKKYNLWFHVDAAFGGFFKLTKRGKKLLSGMENADSIVLDPHKTLFMPYGTGCLLVKNINDLKRANSHTGACMHKGMPKEFPEDIMNLGPELSRNFRGFSVWLPMKLLGIKSFENELDNKLDLTQYCFENVKNLPFINIIHKPTLTVFAFKIDKNTLINNYKKDNIFKESIETGLFDELMLDEMNQEFLDNINKRGRVLLSAFRSIKNRKGEFSLRIAISSFRTQKSHVNYAIQDIKDASLETVEKYAEKLEKMQQELLQPK